METKHEQIEQIEQIEQNRVAVIIVGMARLYKKGHANIKKHLVDRFPETRFDFFLTTWNVNGDYSYLGKDFHAALDQNWIRDDRLSTGSIQEIQHLYQPKSFRILDYQNWKQFEQDFHQQFLKTHHLEEEPIRTFNGIFGQYYQVHQGFEQFQQYLTEQHQNTQVYDLVIRTRYDLEFVDSDQFDLDQLITLVKGNQNAVISTEQWDRNGIRGNFIAGSEQSMIKYAQLYPSLKNLSVEQVNQTKLSSITIPKFVFNYILPNHNVFEMNHEEIFETVQTEFYQKVNQFLSKPTQRLYFNHSLIPEIFLKYYLTEIQHLEVLIIQNLELKAIDGQKSHAI